MTASEETKSDTANWATQHTVYKDEDVRSRSRARGQNGLANTLPLSSRPGKGTFLFYFLFLSWGGFLGF